jgi:hypothetical protein
LTFLGGWAVGFVADFGVGVGEDEVLFEAFAEAFEIDVGLLVAEETLAGRSRVGAGDLVAGDGDLRPDGALRMTLVPVDETLLMVRVSNSSSIISPSRGKERYSHSPGLPRRYVMFPVRRLLISTLSILAWSIRDLTSSVSEKVR